MFATNKMFADKFAANRCPSPVKNLLKAGCLSTLFQLTSVSHLLCLLDGFSMTVINMIHYRIDMIYDTIPYDTT